MVMLNTVDSVTRANGSARPPVLFIHGLWLKPSSFMRWEDLFEEAGHVALSPGWPGEVGSDAGTESIGEVVEHYARIARQLAAKPVIVGHSFGGLIAQILAGRGLAHATVAISPAPFRGVLPLPISALRSAWPVLRNPANAGRRVALTQSEFRYAFGNGVTSVESESLFAEFHAPAPGRPVFQVAAANLNPWTQARADTRAIGRGELLLISAERDHVVPPAVVEAAYRLQSRNASAGTHLLQAPDRGHSLTIDSGWRDIAEKALAFADAASAVGPLSTRIPKLRGRAGAPALTIA